MAHANEEMTLYIQEARELLAVMEDMLLHGKNNLLSVEQIHTVFRAAHTMKGSAAIYDFTQMVTLTHQIESVLDKVRHQPDIMTHECLVLLLACTDFLSQQTDHIERSATEDRSPVMMQTQQQLLHDLQHCLPEITAAELPSQLPQGKPETADVTDQYVRIDVKKLDELVDLMGELMIASASNELAARINRDVQLQETAERMVALSKVIRETTLSFRMVRIHDIFQRFPRVVREMARELNKDIVLTCSGEDTELDKAMMENVSNPLMHLIRNAADHGIETEHTRLLLGKPAAGHIALCARHESGSVVIEVNDDGRGLNIEKIREKGRAQGLIQENDVLSDQDVAHLVFIPGFSTAENVTELSGRGVGMDVVKKDIEQLQGTISIESVPDQGTTVQIRIPLTLSMIHGFLVTVDDLNFVVPLNMAAECVNLSLYPVRQQMLMLRDKTLPIVSLRDMLGMPPRHTPRQNVVILHDGHQHIGLLADGFLGECHVVIKPMNPIFKKRKGLSGTTMLSDGRIAFILDIAFVMQQAVAQEAVY